MATFEDLRHLPDDYIRIIMNFKTQRCSKSCVDLLNCPFYHSLEDMRRPLYDLNGNLLYITGSSPCNCANLLCQYAHNAYEINYHPSKFKSVSCLNFKNCGARTNFCPFLHDGEINALNFPYASTRNGFNGNGFSIKNNKSNKINFQNNPFGGKNQVVLQIDKLQKNFEYPDKIILFKVEKCLLMEESHNWNQCQFYHNDKDKRRIIGNYSAERCSLKNCLQGDECEFSHNDPEQLYHPDKYKKRFCSMYPNEIDKCKFGNFCSFAHHESEIRLTLLEKLTHDDEFNLFYYKTVWCPKNGPHDKAQCVYAHNVQDFRRTPLEYFYDPDECNFWCKIDNKNKYEKGGCSKMMECNKCHGWKEPEYHPFNYKKWKCTLGETCCKKECAYLHNHDDKQKIAILIDHYSKKKTKNQNTYNKSMNKEYKNKSFKQKNESNFKQPIIVSNNLNFSDLILPINNIVSNPKKMLKMPKEPYKSQKGSRCESVTSNDENSSGSGEPHNFNFTNDLRNNSSDSQEDRQKKIASGNMNTGKTTKTTLSRDSSIFIPSELKTINILANNEFERKSDKEQAPKKNEKQSGYQSCPATPDYFGFEVKNYDLFEQKKTIFSTEFRKKFENLNITNVLEKFIKNFYFEDTIKKMKLSDLDKLEFLNEKERAKIVKILEEINSQI